MTDDLETYPVVSDEKVRWGDMDSYQHVNNIKYFQYFETARIAYFARVAFERGESAAEVGPILAETACRFRRPLTYPDTLKVGARVTQLRKNDMLMEFAIFSETTKAIVATGTGRIVSYDYAHSTKTTFPAEVLEKIGRLQPELGG